MHNGIRGFCERVSSTVIKLNKNFVRFTERLEPWPNKATAPNAAMTLRFQIERDGRGIGESRRWM
jgi:hypothetical protein